MVASVVITFIVLVALSTPIVFALGLSGLVGLVLGNFSLQKLPSALAGGSTRRGAPVIAVVLAEYFFSGISGSTIADVSAIGSMLTPPMLRAGYKPEHAASLLRSAAAM